MRERKKIRLSGYDYAGAGAYFITTCVQGRHNLLGEIVDGVMHANRWGRIVDQQWQWLFTQYDYVTMDEYVVMPNHFHGVLWIGNGRDRSLRDHTDRDSVKPQKIKSLPELMGAFKSTSSKLIHRGGLMRFRWQKSYHDHIIRNAKDLERIRRYIRNNPLQWTQDRFYRAHRTGM